MILQAEDYYVNTKLSSAMIW